MTMTSLRLPSLLIAAGMAGSLAAAADDAGKLAVAEFAPTGMVGSVVAITVDPAGRAYVTETHRRTNAAIDIRKHPDWLLESLACTSIDDKRALIHRRMPDWKSLESFKERIIRVEDTDGDGVADKRTVVFDGFGTDINGVAAGVLWYQGALYVTSYPSLYRLTDPDGDGIFDKQEELVTGFGIHVGYGGHDMHGPTLGVDGRIYWSMGDKGVSVTKDGVHTYLPGQGGVFRIEPDGSHFEVFCHGLRNPFELAFDGQGNLFTVDNDGDMGDKERFMFLAEGSDGGWRAHYQYREGSKWPEIVAYNPWMADGLWKPPFAEQPAYLTPALSNYSDGPVGFKWEPGTALDDHYRGWFFLAESTKKLTAFRAEPQGAGFRQVGAHLIAAGPFATGLAFGPDGALYAADWGDNEWLPHQRGRVIRYDDPAMAKDSARAQTRQLLAEGMAKRSAVQLQALLAHADQRVRLQAQLQLADSGEAGRKTLTMVAAEAAAGAAVPAARLHAIWGLGQIARRRHDADALATLTGLLADADPEVRAQAAKMLGDAGHAAAGDAVAKLLADPSPRPRLLAGIALAHLGAPQHLPLAVAMLAANADQDVFLRHAGVMALVGSARNDRAPLLALASHPAVAVRRAAVVALRMLGEPGVARFLDDADQAVAAEAARAIHDDLSIPAALPALAAALAREDRDDDALLRRAISANLRLGDEPSARRLAAFAARRTAPAELRAEALDSLGAWGKPLVLDRVQAFHRGLPARDRAVATAAIAPSLEGLLFGKSKTVQRATARLIAALELADWRDRVSALAVDPARDADLRVIALATMEAMAAPQLDDAIAKALADSAAPLRAAALGTLARRHPKDDASYDAIAKVLASDALADRQLALGVLGTLTAKRAVAMLDQYLERWKAGTLPAELRLDVASAVRAQGDKGLKTKLAGLEKQLAAADPRGLAVLALEGGDPVAGEKLVRGAGTISCLQCHSLGGGGSGVGPDLLHVASRLDRSRLLTALVDPSAEIAEGFGLVNLTLKDGTVLSGALASETATEVVIRPVGGQPQPVAKAAIATRSKPVSIMPPMGANLTLVEMRDVVAFLATLK